MLALSGGNVPYYLLFVFLPRPWRNYVSTLYLVALCSNCGAWGLVVCYCGRSSSFHFFAADIYDSVLFTLTVRTRVEHINRALKLAVEYFSTPISCAQSTHKMARRTAAAITFCLLASAGATEFPPGALEPLAIGAVTPLRLDPKRRFAEDRPNTSQEGWLPENVKLDSARNGNINLQITNPYFRLCESRVRMCHPSITY